MKRALCVTIGNKIRKLRGKRSVAVLSDGSGISEVVWYNVERGNYNTTRERWQLPMLTTLYRMAAALKVEVSELIPSHRKLSREMSA